MNAAFVITWTVPFPGREPQAMQFAADSSEYWEKQAAEGNCTTPEWFFLPGRGMWMVKGDRAVLEGLVGSDPVRRLMARGLLTLENWTWWVADAGEGAERFLADFAAALATV